MSSEFFKFERKEGAAIGRRWNAIWWEKLGTSLIWFVSWSWTFCLFAWEMKIERESQHNNESEMEERETGSARLGQNGNLKHYVDVVIHSYLDFLLFGMLPVPKLKNKNMELRDRIFKHYNESDAPLDVPLSRSISSYCQFDLGTYFCLHRLTQHNRQRALTLSLRWNQSRAVSLTSWNHCSPSSALS